VILTLVMVFDYDGCERYYCVECCASRARNYPIEQNSVWTALTAAVEHVRSVHGDQEFRLILGKRMDEIAEVIAGRRRELK